jgi:hypothetical protein
MLRQEGLLYEKVELLLLTDEYASAENIRDGLNWLQYQTTQQDVAMLFMAGHGINNNVGDFYFMPVNADAERLNATCVGYQEIKRTIDANAGKLLVFMDACHSGNVLGNTQQRAAAVSEAVSELTGADNGPVVFTSSTGRQFSLESAEWNNGAFTKALVEGLNGKAELPGNNTITVKSLDYYISTRVKELTGGRQAPTTIIPNSIPDFPIAMVIDVTVVASGGGSETASVSITLGADISLSTGDAASTREMTLGITAGASAFGDVSFGDVTGGRAAVIGAEAVWFLNRYAGIGLKVNIHTAKVDFGEPVCNDRVMFAGPVFHFRPINRKRIALTAGAGAGALNWNRSFSTWESGAKNQSATSFGGFFTAGVHYMATQHIGFSINIQTLAGKIKSDGFQRNPAGLGATAGVHFRF